MIPFIFSTRNRIPYARCRPSIARSLRVQERHECYLASNESTWTFVNVYVNGNLEAIYSK